ncbi:hypothetical protein [Nonomuraea pusilla]|uniref:Uncharacterized protein n=1 Tax=Nonomuraea pusilla TaxID=46177 RepID=A0A1H8K2E8_9ACTN|nr:hypothetical protein [Nonomuraea pusilla]SEN87122.1 hypothetical protein SAMN05660976_08506 [Nonomuraea pusilla]
MADYDPPSDLLQLKQDFLLADAECGEIGRLIQSGVAVLALEAEPDPERQAQLEDARARRLDLVERIHRHEWWSTVDNRYKADAALLQAAKEQLVTRP